MLYVFRALLVTLIFLSFYPGQANTAEQSKGYIAFVTRGEIPSVQGDLVLLDPASQQELRFNVGILEPTTLAWSPDGLQLSFGQADGGSYELAIFSLLNEQVQLLTDTSDWEGLAAWSPDGMYIAYTAEQRLDNGSNFTSHLLDLNSVTSLQLTPDLLNSTSLKWSPDGTTIAFIGRTRLDHGEHSDLYILKLSSAEIVKLTHNDTNDFMPDWSPDGSQIAFISDSEIALVDADGTNHSVLTVNEQASSPRWLPDRSHILYISHKDNQAHMSMLDPANGAITRLFEKAAIGSFDISPDGSQIAYIGRTRGDLSRLCIFHLVTVDEWCSETLPFGASAVAWGNELHSTCSNCPSSDK